MIARSPKQRAVDVSRILPNSFTAEKPIARFELKALVSDIAARAPVDNEKVAQLRGALAAGTYRIDVARIADAMLVAR